MDPEISVEIAPPQDAASESTADAAAQVAQAAAVVAATAVAQDAHADSPILAALATFRDEIFGRLDAVFNRLEKLEQDIFVLDGKADELLTMELAEEIQPDPVEAVSPPAVVVTGDAPTTVVAENIPPESAAVIEEPTPRRKKATRWL